MVKFPSVIHYLSHEVRPSHCHEAAGRSVLPRNGKMEWGETKCCTFIEINSSLPHLFRCLIYFVSRPRNAASARWRGHITVVASRNFEFAQELCDTYSYMHAVQDQYSINDFKSIAAAA